MNAIVDFTSGTEIVSDDGSQSNGSASNWLPLFTLLFASLLVLTVETGIVQAQGKPSESAETSEPLLEQWVIKGKCMGPIDYKVTIVDPPSDQTQASFKKAVQQTLDRINERMSTYIDDSYVSEFNASDSTEFMACDGETALVVQRAIEISKLTEGAFDVTVGPAVELWGFGRGDWRPGDPFEPPSDQDIKKTLEVVGYQKLTVRLDPPSLKKSHPGVQINLSAIAKGYAVDQVLERLAKMGCKNILVSVGGEVRGTGHRQNRAAWGVAVKQPDSFLDEIETLGLISDGAMATSGDYENFRRVGKKRYSHTINPVTGRPVEHSMASAGVLAGDCMTADALATAALVLGRQRAIKLLESQGSDYYLIERTGDFSGKYNRYASETFPFADEADRKKLTPSIPSETNQSSIWPVFLASLCGFGLMILAMAVGAIFNNKPVKGSCGGLANVTNEDGETNCGICAKPVTDCVEVTGATNGG